MSRNILEDFNLPLCLSLSLCTLPLPPLSSRQFLPAEAALALCRRWVSAGRRTERGNRWPDSNLVLLLSWAATVQEEEEEEEEKKKRKKEKKRRRKMRKRNTATFLEE